MGQPIGRTAETDERLRVLLSRAVRVTRMFSDYCQIQIRLERYNRRPDARKEGRLEMDICDRLQLGRDVWAFEEFSPSWNGIPDWGGP